MKMFDSSILVRAHREDQSGHAFFRREVENVANAGESFAVSTLVAARFVRLVTDEAFENGPTPLAQALAVIDGILAIKSCVLVGPGRRHWRLTTQLCRDCDARGRRVDEAQQAAIAIEHACEWLTDSTSYEEFSKHGLKWRLLSP